VLIQGNASTTAQIPLDVQATNDPNSATTLFRVGDAGEANAFAVLGSGYARSSGPLQSYSGAGAFCQMANGIAKSVRVDPTYIFEDYATGHDDWSIIVDEDHMRFVQSVGDSTETDRVKLWGDGSLGMVGIVSQAITHVGYAGIVAFTNSGVTELWAWDSAGTHTQLSAHDSATGKGIEHSFNVYTGERRLFRREEWQDAMVKSGTFISPSEFLVITTDAPVIHPELNTPAKRWAAAQADEAATREAKIAETEAAIATWEADPKPIEEKGEKPVKPEKYKAVPRPQWLVDAFKPTEPGR